MHIKIVTTILRKMCSAQVYPVYLFDNPFCALFLSYSHVEVSMCLFFKTRNNVIAYITWTYCLNLHVLPYAVCVNLLFTDAVNSIWPPCVHGQAVAAVLERFDAQNGTTAGTENFMYMFKIYCFDTSHYLSSKISLTTTPCFRPKHIIS